ncbi:MAG: hypothetical protein AAGB13_12990, partial [Cyanobacteria bacterium P01_F01_bin.33]
MQVVRQIPEGEFGQIGMSALTEDYVFCYSVEPNWHYEILTFNSSLEYKSRVPFKLNGGTRKTYQFSNSPAPVLDTDNQDLYFILSTEINERFDALVLTDVSDPRRQIDVNLPRIPENKNHIFAFTSVKQGVFGLSTYFRDRSTTGFELYFWSWQDIQEGIAPKRQFINFPAEQIRRFEIQQIQAATVPIFVGEEEPSLVFSFSGSWETPAMPDCNWTGAISVEISWVLDGGELVLRDPIWSEIVKQPYSPDGSVPSPVGYALTLGLDNELRALVVDEGSNFQTPKLYTRTSAEKWSLLGAPIGTFVTSNQTNFFNYATRPGPQTLKETNQLLQILRHSRGAKKRELILDSLEFAWRDRTAGRDIKAVAVGRDGDAIGIEPVSEMVLRLDR